MKELIDHIPFIDLMIVGLLSLFLFVGWKQGLPKLIMTLGALYTGFLLTSIYYHLFAMMVAKAFSIKAGFFTDFIGFLLLDLTITLLMMALLFSLFGHLKIKGRWSVFDRIGGSLSGFFAGVLILGIAITLLRVPHEANKQKLDPSSDIAAVELFNAGYVKSTLAPVFIKGAPYLVASTSPMLPPEVHEKGVIPLLETMAHQQQ